MTKNPAAPTQKSTEGDTIARNKSADNEDIEKISQNTKDKGAIEEELSARTSINKFPSSQTGTSSNENGNSVVEDSQIPDETRILRNYRRVLIEIEDDFANKSPILKNIDDFFPNYSGLYTALTRIFNLIDSRNYSKDKQVSEHNTDDNGKSPVSPIRVGTRLFQNKLKRLMHGIISVFIEEGSMLKEFLINYCKNRDIDLKVFRPERILRGTGNWADSVLEVDYINELRNLIESELKEWKGNGIILLDLDNLYRNSHLNISIRISSANFAADGPSTINKYFNAIPALQVQLMDSVLGIRYSKFDKCLVISRTVNSASVPNHILAGLPAYSDFLMRINKPTNKEKHDLLEQGITYLFGKAGHSERSISSSNSAPSGDNSIGDLKVRHSNGEKTDEGSDVDRDDKGQNELNTGDVISDKLFGDDENDENNVEYDWSELNPLIKDWNYAELNDFIRFIAFNYGASFLDISSSEFSVNSTQTPKNRKIIRPDIKELKKQIREYNEFLRTIGKVEGNIAEQADLGTPGKSIAGITADSGNIGQIGGELSVSPALASTMKEYEEQMYLDAASKYYNDLSLILKKIRDEEPLDDGDREIISYYPFILRAKPEQAISKLENAYLKYLKIKKALGKSK